MIDNIKLSASPIKPANKEEIQAKQSFGKIKLKETPDSFESASIQKPKQKSKVELALIGITGAGVAAVAILRGKLGSALKLVGEKPPITITGRLKKLIDLSSKDSMTGLLNKKALLSNLDKEYKKAVKTGTDFGVGMFDLDNFKAINELKSHKTGDQVLIRIASIIQEVAEKHGGKSFRYGGEEFVVTLAGKDKATFEELTKGIAKRIKEDELIQGLVPELQKNAKEGLEFVKPKIAQLDTIFSKLRGETKIENHQELADEIIKLVETHIKKYEPSDTTYLDNLIKTLKSTKPEELPEILKTKTIVEPDGTLGKELDKLQNQYNGCKNDFIKWLNQFETNGNIQTTSGGTINLSDTKLIENGETLVNVADGALKSAKENGKNQIVTANDEIIKKILEQLNKKKA